MDSLGGQGFKAVDRVAQNDQMVPNIVGHGQIVFPRWQKWEAMPVKVNVLRWQIS